jgi:hypothetical protein
MDVSDEDAVESSLMDRRWQMLGMLGSTRGRRASPLFGAGRVEDTFNVIGHAARGLFAGGRQATRPRRGDGSTADVEDDEPTGPTGREADIGARPR